MALQIKDAFGRELKLEDVLSSVGKGWHPLVKRLIEDLFSLGWDGELRQIKEKFGGLRFYIGASSEKIFERIYQAELESESTCDECGEPGKTSSWGGYWVIALCPSHGEKRAQEIAARKKQNP